MLASHVCSGGMRGAATVSGRALSFREGMQSAGGDLAEKRQDGRESD